MDVDITPITTNLQPEEGYAGTALAHYRIISLDPHICTPSPLMLHFCGGGGADAEERYCPSQGRCRRHQRKGRWTRRSGGHFGSRQAQGGKGARCSLN